MWSKSHNPTLPSELKKWHIVVVSDSKAKWKIIEISWWLAKVLLWKDEVVNKNLRDLKHVKSSN